MQHTISPQTGFGFELQRGQSLTITDIAGGQVADLFAVVRANPTDWLSSGRSIDNNGRLHLTTGDILYSNESHPLLTITADTVGKHDFLFSPCSQRMFEMQYGVTEPHPNCLDNLAAALAPYGIPRHRITVPFNVFMNASIDPTGAISIAPPLSQAGDNITFRAEIDLYVAVSACSAGKANNYRFGPVGVAVGGQNNGQ